MTKPRPIGRELRDKLLAINSGELSDSLDSFGVASVFPSVLKRCTGQGRRFFGRAFTVEWMPSRKGANICDPVPSTWSQVRAFLVPEITDGTELVYVAGGNTLVRDAALAGGLSARYFERIGFEGMVLGGAVRDLDELQRLAIPVVATGFCPVDTQGAYRIVSTGIRCSIGGVNVNTGDIVFSDDTGVVVIPEAIEEDVVERAWCISRREAEIAQRIDNGEPLHSLVDEVGQI